MNPRFCLGVLTTLLIVPAVAFAQSSDVTFTMPLNLTKLSGDITKVAVFCEITSDALTTGRLVPKSITTRRVSKQEEFSVTGGQIVTKAAVVVPVGSLNLTATSNASTADYRCTLSGFSQSLQQWQPFGPGSQTAAFRASPDPVELTGSFKW